MDSKIEASNGIAVRKTTVFAHCIKFLRHEAVNVIRHETGDESYKVDDIHWVLTVPITWTSRAKQFMREAAYEVRPYHYCSDLFFILRRISLKRYFHFEREHTFTRSLSKLITETENLENHQQRPDLTVIRSPSSSSSPPVFHKSNDNLFSSLIHFFFS